MKNGPIVICNWNKFADKIIKEIHSPTAEPETEIIVITNIELDEYEKKKTEENDEYRNVVFINGDPFLHRVLEAAKTYNAKSIIILSEETNPDPDAYTILISLGIKKICEERKVEKPFIVAESQNHKKTEHLKNSGVDEIIPVKSYGFQLLGQSVLTSSYLTSVYDRLLSYSKDTNEFYIIQYEQNSKFFINIENKSFFEVQKIFDEKQQPDNSVLLIGVRRPCKHKNNETCINIKNQEIRCKTNCDSLFLNPKDRNFRFAKGDSIVVMAYRKPDIDTFVS